MRHALTSLLLLFSGALLLSAQTVYPETPPRYDAEKIATALLYDILQDGKLVEERGKQRFTIRFLVQSNGEVTDFDVEGVAPPLSLLRSVMNRMPPATWRGAPIAVEWEIPIAYETIRKGPEQHMVVTVDGKSFSEQILEGKAVQTESKLNGPEIQTVFEPFESGTVDVDFLAESLIRGEYEWGYPDSYTIGLTADIIVEPDSSHGKPVAIRVKRPPHDPVLSSLWVNLLYDTLLNLTTGPGLRSDGEPVRSILEVALLVVVVREDEQRRIRIGLRNGSPTSYLFISEIGQQLPAAGAIKIESGPIDDFTPLLSESVIVEEGDLTFIPWATPAAYDRSELAGNIIYPPMAIEYGLEGRVVLQVHIASTGELESIEILRSDNRIFNEAAIEAVRKTTFTPAIQNGVALRYRMPVVVKFELKPPTGAKKQ